MVQVWAGNDMVDNFADHWRDYQRKILGNQDIKLYKGAHPDSFPTHLPLSLFKDKKEGDIVTLRRADGLVINLELNQLQSRYRNFGKFEEILSLLVEQTKKEEVEA